MTDHRTNLRVVGGPPAPPPPGGFPVYSREACRQLRAILNLSEAVRTEVLRALEVLAANNGALRTMALNAHLQSQLDALSDEN